MIDSGSQDNIVIFAKLAGARIFEISLQKFNYGLTRDFVISQANTEHVILMVQDAIPADFNMLETLLLALMENETVAGVYSRQIPQENADVITKRNLNTWLTGRTVREVRSIPYEGWYESLSSMDKYHFCNFDNVCSAIKKSVWKIESFGDVKFGEDIDWAERVLKRSYKIIFEPSSSVVHSHSRSLKYEYKRTYVCHRKLYRMFGLHLVRNLKELLKSWIHASSTDIIYILQYENRLIPKIKMILKVPFLNFLSVLAQYQAVKNVIRGVSKPISGV